MDPRPRTWLAIGLLLIATGVVVGGGLALGARARGGSRASGRSEPEAARQPEIVLSSERLDFGDFDVARAVVRHLLLRNTGDETVRLRLELAGSAFAIEPSELVLEPGRISRVMVTAAASRPGPIRDELRIARVGSRETFVVELQGRALSGGAGMLDIVDVDAGGSGTIERGESGEVRETAALARRSPSGNFGSAAEAWDPARSAPSHGGGSAPFAGAGAGAESGIGRRSIHGAAPGMVVVPIQPGVDRSLADRPDDPSPNQPPSDGEAPVPVRPGPKNPAADEPPRPADPAPKPKTPVLVVSPSSSIAVMGSSNRFHPQALRVLGSARGGSFSLGSHLQMPSIPLAFGQSMAFSQSNSAVGSYDPASGEVTFDLPIHAIDPNGNAAPLVIPMTTGTVVARNDTGILISMSGTPRAPESGQLRLVGIGRIPVGYRNGAEERIVTVEIVGALSFPARSEGGSEP